MKGKVVRSREVKLTSVRIRPAGFHCVAYPARLLQLLSNQVTFCPSRVAVRVAVRAVLPFARENAGKTALVRVVIRLLRLRILIVVVIVIRQVDWIRGW
jgi:hypothetical protein